MQDRPHFIQRITPPLWSAGLLAGIMFRGATSPRWPEAAATQCRRERRRSNRELIFVSMPLPSTEVLGYCLMREMKDQ